MKKFKKGLFLGGLLGAGLTWLNATKKGKKTRDQIIHHASIVYKNVKKEILASDGWQEMTKHEYVQKVEAMVQKYAVETGLSKKVKKLVEKLVIAQWKRFHDDVKENTDETTDTKDTSRFDDIL